jgi:AcrR family transcriptional regulator
MGSEYPHRVVGVRTEGGVARRSQHERLLDAMTECVAERSYVGTSVAHVIAVAGVSRRTFYEHFENKRACFLGAYDAIVERCRVRVLDAYERPGPWHERIEAAFDAFLDFLVAEPDAARLCVVEVLSAGPESLSRRDRAMQGFARLLDVCRVGAPSDSQAPNLVAEAIVGGIYELIYARIVRDQIDELPALLPQIMTYTLVSFGALPRGGHHPV